MQEVRQLTEAGIPILKDLSNYLSEVEGKFVSVGEVFDRISSRQVTFEMVEKVFKDMTEEGGKFYQMQEVLADTLSGKLSNLTDAFQIMLSEIGDKSNGFLYGAVDGLRKLIENYEDVGKAITRLIVVYGTYRAAVVATNIVEKENLILQVSKKYNLGISSMTALAKATKMVALESKGLQTILKGISKVNPYALILSSGMMIVNGLIKTSKEMTELQKMQKELNVEVEKFNKESADEELHLRYLFDKMKNLDSASEEYYKTKKKILQQYGDYLTEIDKENIALGNQEVVYKNLVRAVREASMEKAAAAGREKIDKYFNELADGIFVGLKATLERVGVNASGEIAAQIGDYIRGETTILSDETLAVIKNIEDEWNKGRNWDQAGHEYNTSGIFKIDTLKQSMEDARQMYTDENEKLLKDIRFIYGAVQTEGTQPLKDWQQSLVDIAKAADDAQISTGVIIDRQTSLAEAIQSVSDKIKESQNAYEQALGIEDETAAVEKKRLEYLQQMNAVLKGKATPSSSKGASTSGNPLAADVERIKDQIAAYQRLKKAYADLAEYLSDNEVRETMKIFFPNETEMIMKNYDDEIEALVASLDDLGEAGQEAAKVFKDKLGLEGVAALIEKLANRRKTDDDFASYMQSWLDAIDPAGADITKIVKNYERALREIEDKKREAKKKLFAREEAKEPGQGAWGADFAQQQMTIDNAAITESINALDDAKEAAMKKIEEIYKDWRENNVDFDTLSQKSILELNNLKDAINQFSTEKNIDPKTLEALQSLGIGIEQVRDLIEKLKKTDIGKMGGAIETKQITAWKMLAQNILDASGALADFAEASGNGALLTLSKTISFAGELFKNTLEGFKKGDVLGAVVAGVSTIATKALEIATQAAETRNAVRELAMSGYLEAINDAIEGSSTIFGDSWGRKIAEINNGLRSVLANVKNLTKWSGTEIDNEFLGGLKEFARQLDVDLWKDQARNIFDPEALELIFDRYKGRFTKQGKEDMEDLIEYSKALIDLYDQLDEAITTMFGNLGEAITDKVIDNLWAVGDAAADLEDVFGNLGNSIFRSLVQSIVIDEILAKYKDEVESWWTSGLSTEDIAARFSEFAKKVSADLDEASTDVMALYDAFKEYNLISNESANDNTLANGIKGVTEDTANLLASYINAIRADVAFNRMQIGQILEAMPKAPILADYLMQIQANTFNTAENTQAILSELRSMMTVSDGPALRVFM